MPRVHATERPISRLCHLIRYCGGTSGEKVTVPVKPASFHCSCALTVFRSSRLITSHRSRGVGVGAGGRGVGFGVGFGAGGGWGALVCAGAGAAVRCGAAEGVVSEGDVDGA